MNISNKIPISNRTAQIYRQELNTEKLTDQRRWHSAEDGEKLVSAMEEHDEYADNQLKSFDQNQSEVFIDNLLTAENMTDAKNIEPKDETVLKEEIFLSKYITSDDLDILKNCYMDKKDAFLELAQMLENTPHGTEIQLLNNYVKANNLTKAQIYLCLSYILQFLAAKETKQDFLEEVNKILNKYHSQQASYFLNFFSILKNNKLSKQINHAQAEVLANFGAGNLHLQSLKQTVQYLLHLFKDDWRGIVSTYIQIHARQLGYLTKDTLLPEDRIKLIELLNMELKLQLVYSMFVQVDQFKEQLGARNLISKLSVADFLLCIFNLIEVNFLGEAQITSWFASCGLPNLSKKQLVKCLLLLVKTLRIFPEQAFNSSKEKYNKIIDAIRNAITSSDNETKDRKPQVSFLKLRNQIFENA